MFSQQWHWLVWHWLLFHHCDRQQHSGCIELYSFLSLLKLSFIWNICSIGDRSTTLNITYFYYTKNNFLSKRQTYIRFVDWHTLCWLIFTLQMLYHRIHWKCYTPKIHQIQILKFLSTYWLGNQSQMNPKSQFEFAERSTEISEFLDLVDFGGVAIWVWTVILNQAISFSQQHLILETTICFHHLAWWWNWVT